MTLCFYILVQESEFLSQIIPSANSYVADSFVQLYFRSELSALNHRSNELPSIKTYQDFNHRLLKLNVFIT